MLEAAWLGSFPKSRMSTACHAATTIVRHSTRKTTSMPPVSTKVPWDESRWDDVSPTPDWSGHLKVFRPDHPGASERGYVHRYRAVWWIHTGNDVRSGYDLHHVDLDPQNDVFENLTELTHGDHRRLHSKGTGGVECVCKQCGVKFKVRPSAFARGEGQYCGRVCFALMPKTDVTLSRMSESQKLAYSEGRR